MNIVCYYADLGRPYLPLLERMTASAKRLMPKARTVLLTPTPKPELAALFDHTCGIDLETTFDNLCVERARAMVSWMMSPQTEETVFVDPDLEFQQPVKFDASFDVGLLWRDGKPDQPINTGMILAHPGSPEFWKHYGAISVNLPLAIHGWFADQLSFSLLTGVCHGAGDRLRVDDARVWLMDAPKYCDQPKKVKPNAWAVHYKGPLKGPGWEDVFRSDKEIAA